MRIFVLVFGANNGVFRGALRVPNFYVASLCVRNCILTIKLLAISKTAKLEFLFRIFRINKGSLGCSAVLWGFSIFLQLFSALIIVFRQ